VQGPLCKGLSLATIDLKSAASYIPTRLFTLHASFGAYSDRRCPSSPENDGRDGQGKRRAIPQLVEAESEQRARQNPRLCLLKSCPRYMNVRTRSSFSDYVCLAPHCICFFISWFLSLVFHPNHSTEAAMTTTVTPVTETRSNFIKDLNRGPITSVFTPAPSCTETLRLVTQDSTSWLYFGHAYNPYFQPGCMPTGTRAESVLSDPARWDSYYCMPALPNAFNPVHN
jgi:hypothetical protein